MDIDQELPHNPLVIITNHNRKQLKPLSKPIQRLAKRSQRINQTAFDPEKNLSRAKKPGLKLELDTEVRDPLKRRPPALRQLKLRVLPTRVHSEYERV